MLKAYRYRLYPNTKQKEQLAQHFGCARYVYNWVLATRKTYYESHGKTLSQRDLQDKLVHEEKKTHIWLKAVNSQSLLASMRHAVDAYGRFFKGLSRYPRFKSKKNAWQSYQCPQHVQVHAENHCIKLPMIGWVKANIHRTFTGDIKTCTIKRTPHGAYLISVLVEDHALLPEPKPIDEKTTLGVDVGINHLAITSDGRKFANPRCLNQGLSSIQALSQSLARKKKGSNNRGKARLRLAKKHTQVARARAHALHQCANQLLCDNQTVTVALEDLHIKGMLKNRKLARHIADVAWSRFNELLAYKASWTGKNIIRCNRFAPSSKQCCCGFKNTALSLSDRIWTCPDCHTTHDRDILAAQNIKAFSLAEAVGHTVCVKPFPLHGSTQRSSEGERSNQRLDGSQEAPTRPSIALAVVG